MTNRKDGFQHFCTNLNSDQVNKLVEIANKDTPDSTKVLAGPLGAVREAREITLDDMKKFVKDWPVGIFESGELITFCKTREGAEAELKFGDEIFVIQRAVHHLINDARIKYNLSQRIVEHMVKDIAEEL